MSTKGQFYEENLNMIKLSYPFIVSTMFYMITMLMFFNSMSSLTLFFLLEVNTLLFIMILQNPNKSYSINMKLESSFYYFIVQSLFSLILILSIIKVEELSSLGLNIWLNMLALIMCMKMGLFPFLFWLLNLSKKLNPMLMLLMLTIQKVPMISLIPMMNNNMMLVILMLNMTVGVLMLMYSSSLNMMMLSSSIYGFMWMWIMMLYSEVMFWSYFFLYFLSNLMLVLIFTKEKFNKKVASLICLMFLLNSPPLSSFMNKLVSIMDMLIVTMMLKILLMTLTGFSILGYFKFMLSNVMLSEEKLYFIKMNKMISYLYLIVMISLILYI